MKYRYRTFLFEINALSGVTAVQDLLPVPRNIHLSYIVQNHSGVTI